MFENVLEGIYTIKIEKSGFNAAIINDIDVLSKQEYQVALTYMDLKVCGLPGDINADEKIDLIEAMNALQVVSGLKAY